VHRRGTLYRLLSLIGLFPWECANCGQIVLLRQRGHKT